MTCDRAFDRYLALDKNERVPLRVTLHLFGCPACRTAVRRMTRAEALLARPLAPVPSAAVSSVTETADPVLLAAMERIRLSGLAYPDLSADEGRVSMTRWVVAGVALVVGFAIQSGTALGDWSRLVFGNSYSVPFSILCGVAVTVFGGLFIGSNIDFFVKKFGIRAS
jgi:predicted anti-sigma-YlaC factor YlaD